MPDAKFTEFLLDLCTNQDGLLEKYLANRDEVIAAADLDDKTKEAFAKLPAEVELRAAIRNTQGGGGGGGGSKKTAKKKPAKKAAKKKAAKKAAKGGKKR